MHLFFTRLFVSERKQIALMADEKLHTQISHRLFATSRSEMRVDMEAKRMEEVKGHIREIIGDAERSVFFLRRQQFHKGVIHSGALMEKLSESMTLLVSILPELNGREPVAEVEGLLLMFQEIQQAQESRDYVLLADLYCLKLLPVFTKLQERIVLALGVCIDEKQLWSNLQACQKYAPQLLMSLLPQQLLNEIQKGNTFSDTAMEKIVEIVEQTIKKGYFVEDTSSGFFTLSIQKENQSYYFHTNGQIVQEALQQAQEWLAQDKEEYTFYGLGFGYPYLEMLTEDWNISIQVVEMSRELLLLAMVFAPLSQLYESGRFSMVYDPTGHRLKKMGMRVDERAGFYIFYPALQGIKKPQIKQQLEAYFVEESSVRGQRRQLDGNFRKNVRAEYGSLEDLRGEFQGKEFIIVAAGPSLDKNIHLLRKKRDNTVILAVGTVLKKLLVQEIVPDAVMMIDASKSVYGQIQGIEECGVPLLFLSTVFSPIVRDYRAHKYLLCQNGYQPAQELAEKKGWETVETGGSVVTTAFDVGLRLGASRIIFVGLDLAYTGDMDHASGTQIHNQVVEDTGVWVEGIDGKQVKTAKNLKLYKEWLERRIADRSDREKEIEVIDATEGGAKIIGMECMTLQAALDGRRIGGKEHA